MVKWRTETYSQRAASSARPQHVLGTKHRHCNLLLIVYMGLFVAALALAPATEGEGCSSLLKLTRHSAAMAATSGKSHTQALHAPRRYTRPGVLARSVALMLPEKIGRPRVVIQPVAQRIVFADVLRK